METERAPSPAPSPADLYGLAFQASLDAIILHRDGHIIEANPAAARLLGRTRERLRGSSLLACIPSADRERVAQHFRHSDQAQYQTHILRPDGSAVPVSVHGVSHDVDGEALRVTIMRDRPRSSASGRRSRNEMERDAELSRLEQMNQFKTQLLNTAAHELNTPLTPLRLQVHLLRSQNLGKLSDRQGKAIEVLDRNVERLSLLVSDILDVARLESGHLSIEIDDTDLNDLVEESAQSYEETARGVGVELRLETDKDISVKADPRRVLQVIYNLVSNGIKFTPEGGRVTIRTGAEGDHGYVEVEDTGLGMDEAQLTKLFQPFSRVHDTEATAIPGTGLGLYISRGIIEQHGGAMTVRSGGPGKGSTFRITLPLAAEPVRHAKRPPRRRSAMVAGPLAERLRELI